MSTKNNKQMTAFQQAKIQELLKRNSDRKVMHDPKCAVQVTFTEKTERQVTYTYLPTPISVDRHQIVGSTRSVLPQIVDATSNVDTQALIAPQQAPDAAPKTVEKQALDAPQEAADVAKETADVGVKPYFSNAFLVLMTVVLVVFSGFVLFFTNETKQFFCDVQGIYFPVLDNFFRESDDSFYTMFTNRLEQEEMEEHAMEQAMQEQQNLMNMKEREILVMRIGGCALSSVALSYFFSTA